MDIYVIYQRYRDLNYHCGWGFWSGTAYRLFAAGEARTTLAGLQAAETGKRATWPGTEAEYCIMINPKSGVLPEIPNKLIFV